MWTICKDFAQGFWAQKVKYFFNKRVKYSLLKSAVSEALHAVKASWWYSEFACSSCSGLPQLEQLRAHVGVLTVLSELPYYSSHETS